MQSRIALLLIVGIAYLGAVRADEYDVLLRSTSLAEQRAALTAILAKPAQYVPRIQQTLRDYPKLLDKNARSANRAVYLATLVRDPSFPPILAGMLGDEDVIDSCMYACPVVFALTVHAVFGGWSVPATLDKKLTTVSDLLSAIRYASKIDLKVQPLDAAISGPAVERERKKIEGKSEEELIELAGPTAPRGTPRWLAAAALQVSVATSRNRVPLYLLLMNERTDASGELRSSLYTALYRAETALSQGR